jgi:outer membrane cobalamin receptor
MTTLTGLIALLLAAAADAPGGGGDATPADGGAATIPADAAAPADAATPPLSSLSSPARPSPAVPPPPPSPPPSASPSPSPPVARPPRYETVVTGPARPERAPREDPVAAATVVFPDDSPRAFDDLGDLLAEVPGVNVTRSGGIGDFATISLRGSNPDEVRIYLDGVPLNLAVGGAVDMATLPLGDIERIEIYRGTTPIGFPESALGGIIAITTRAPGTRKITARAGAGSFGTMFGDATAGWRSAPFHFYIGGHALVGKDGFRYLDDNGTAANPADDRFRSRDNNGLSQVDGVFRAAVDLPGRRQLGIGMIGLVRGQGLPGTGTVASLHSRLETARGVGYLAYESRDDLGAGSRLRAQAFASANRDRFRDRDGVIGGLPALTEDTTVSAGATVNASRPLAGWLRGAVMAEARRETFQPTNQLDAAPVGTPAERLVGAAGTELALWWRRFDLDVIPSARIEAARDVVTGRDSLFQMHRPASPPVSHLIPVLRLGLARPLSPRLTLKANAGRYGRLPSFFELYADTGQQLGNPLLRPERGWTGDVAAEYRHRGARASLDGRTTFFTAWVDDLIEWIPLAHAQARVDNVGRARIWGVEQDLGLSVGRHLRLTAQGTLLDARDEGDVLSHHDKLLPPRPRYRGYARPELRRLMVAPGVAASVFVEGDVSAGAYFDSNNISPIAARLLVGAGVAVAVARAGLRVTVSAKNLTNVDYLDLTYYPLPGRSVFASVMWSSRPDEP